METQNDCVRYSATIPSSIKGNRVFKVRLGAIAIDPELGGKLGVNLE